MYTQTRDECDRIFQVLGCMIAHIPCFGYHNGYPDDQKCAGHKAWQDASHRKPHIIVATSAFGCGFDVAPVRAVIHLERPRTRIEYLKERGRAGRDGRPAENLALNFQNGTSPQLRSSVDYTPFVSDATVNTPVVYSKEMFGDTKGQKEESKVCSRWLLDVFADGERQTLRFQQRGLQRCHVSSSSPVLPELFDSGWPWKFHRAQRSRGCLQRLQRSPERKASRLYVPPRIRWTNILLR